MFTAAALPQLRNFIAGEWVQGLNTQIILRDPSDGRVLGTQLATSPDMLEGALRCADYCHTADLWFGLGEKRADYLMAIADALEPHLDELAYIEAVSTGVVLKQTRMLAGLLPFIFKGAAAQVSQHPDCTVLEPTKRVEHWHKPWGPALALAPWNSPLPIGAHKLASALAAGAPVILKPSEFTPFSTQRLFEIIASCDLPPGAAQLVHGSQSEGAHLVADRRIKAVSFTGGLAGGRAIARQCAEDLKPIQLELGGHNPFLVLPDADVNAVVDGLIAGLTTLNGQWCRAVGRIFVPRSLRSGVVDGFLARVAALDVGSATAPTSAMGPLVHLGHKQHVLDTVQSLLNLGGQRLSLPNQFSDDSPYLRPELITGIRPEDDTQELFGPMATLHEYDETGDLAANLKTTSNASPFGLAAYIYGKDENLMYRLAKGLAVGSTKINGVTVTSLSANAPRAAWGVSGFGEEGSFETFRFFQGSSVIGKVTQ